MPYGVVTGALWCGTGSGNAVCGSPIAPCATKIFRYGKTVEVRCGGNPDVQLSSPLPRKTPVSRELLVQMMHCLVVGAS